MKRLAVLVVAFLLAASPSLAERVVVGEGSVDLAVRLLQSGEQGTTLEIEIGSFERTPVVIDGETYYSIMLGGESNLMRAGLPDLPNICRSLVIPDDAKMEVSVLSSEYEDLPGVPVAPSKGHILRTIDPSSVPYDFNPLYERDEWFPRDLAALREPFILRDFRGIVEELNVFQYNPATQTLRVYTKMIVELRKVGPGEVNVLTDHHRDAMNTEFHKIYQNQFLNFPSALYAPVGEVGEMLIITHDAFHGAVQPLADWKNQMGMKTTIVDVSTIPNTSSAIETYIENYYNANNLAYVLLVGDAAQIAYPTSAGGAADPVYALISADHYPDLFVGRMSANTIAQAETQVERTITYERDPMGGGDWYHKGMGVGSNQGPGDDGEYDNQHLDNIRADLLGFTYTAADQIYDPTANAGAVSAALNDGRSIINYTGHGSTTAWSSSGFSNTHINALVNDNMLPFIISVACVNGQFAAGTCFAEAWMRATNGSSPTGAIATYMSTINQSWNSPMCGQDEITDLLVAGERRTFGGLCYNGACQMMDEYGADGRDMYDTWHIFGDPSVRVRTATPANLIVSHAPMIEKGVATFTVTVPEVDGALCGLSCNGLHFGSALTSSGGDAVITVDEELTVGEDLTLTVTGFNSVPYIATLPVQAAVDPALCTVTCNDSLMLSPNGNGDAPLVITVTVRNGSGDPVPGVPAGEVVVDAVGVSSNGRDFYFCSSASNTEQFVSTDPTDANGETTITVGEVGGCGTISLTTSAQGVPLIAQPTVNVRSPDINGDGQVQFYDTFIYIQMLSEASGDCGNLNWSADGTVDFNDTIKYLQHLGTFAKCP